MLMGGFKPTAGKDVISRDQQYGPRLSLILNIASKIFINTLTFKPRSLKRTHRPGWLGDHC